MEAPLDIAAAEKGMRFAFFGQSIGILLSMLLLKSAFGPLFLKHLGASDTVVMWVFAVPGLMPLVQIPLSLLVPPNRTKIALLSGWSAWGVLMVPVALTPTLLQPSAGGLGVTASLLVLALLCNMGAATFWFPLLSDLIPAERRGRFFGKLRATWTILLYVSTVLSGLYLGSRPSTGRFQAVILLGVLLVFVRSLFIAKVPTVQRGPGRGAEYREWRRYLREIFVNRPLRRFFVYFTLLGAAAGFLAHPLVLYMSDLGINPRDNILIFGSTTLGMVAVLFAGGRVIDRLGVRGVFTAVHWTLIASLAAAVGVSQLASGAVRFGLVAVFVVSGAAVALANLACTTHLFSQVPKTGRAFFLSFSNLMLAVGPAVALFITGAVLKGVGEARRISLAGIDVDVFQGMLMVAGAIALGTTPLLWRATATMAVHRGDSGPSGC